MAADRDLRNDTGLRTDTDVRVDPARRGRTARPVTVFRHILGVQGRSMVLWSLALAVIAVIYVSFYPAIGEQQMREMAEMIPEGFAAALGYDRLGDAAGYLTATVFGLLGPALFLVFGIGAGGRFVAGTEEDGTLELELTHPVSRRTVYIERLLGLWANLAILVAVFVAVTIALVVGLDIGVGVGALAAGALGLLLFSLAHATLAFALGAATGRRSIGIGVAAVVAVVGYIADAIGPMVEGVGWLETISPWYWFLGGDPLVAGIDVEGFALLAGLTLVAAVVGLARFRRRDLGV